MEGKPVTAVDELKEPDCDNATEETEKDVQVEKGTAEVNLAQILHSTAEEYLSHIHLCGCGLKYSCFNRDL